jgi:hypothetical protein
MGIGGGTVRARSARSTAVAIALAGIGGLAWMAAPAAAKPASGPVEIEVLGNRADLVSDGDALVEVVRPTGTNPDSVRVELNGEDVVDEFALGDDGRFLGLRPFASRPRGSWSRTTRRAVRSSPGPT